MSSRPDRPMVQIEDLWKRYRLGEFGATTLTDDARRGWARIRGRSDPLAPVLDPGTGTSDGGRDNWVLRGLNLDINEGDLFALIGPNGAGKSTVLKILSRITTPTRGVIRTRGRVASLLEVGTGFHPELTGRENIYLNGTIMGMTRRQVARRMDQIIEFSECGTYIDTPVRRYSSGMYVRLGFAVAAHLNVDILAVDEVLAVGDARFQSKCVEKMSSLADEGVTIVFVSHNSSLVQRLCTRAAVINNGTADVYDNVTDALSSYHGGRAAADHEILFPGEELTAPRITRVALDPAGLQDARLTVDMDFAAPTPFVPVPGLIVYGAGMQPVFTSNTRIHSGTNGDGGPVEPCSSGTFRFELPDPPLFSETYSISAWLGAEGVNYDNKEHALTFRLETKHSLPTDLASRFVGHTVTDGSWVLLDSDSARIDGHRHSSL